MCEPSPSFYPGAFLQHGYVAEPLSQEEHDQISQYLTICAYIHKTNSQKNINFVVRQIKCENQAEILSQWRWQAERLVARRNWPSSWGSICSLWSPPNTADLTILRAQFFREVGLGCPEHLGHSHPGARVSEAIVSNAIYVPLWNKIIGETILDKRRCLCFGKCQEKPEQLFEMDPPWCRRYLPNNARIWDTIYKW